MTFFEDIGFVIVLLIIAVIFAVPAYVIVAMAVASLKKLIISSRKHLVTALLKSAHRIASQYRYRHHPEPAITEYLLQYYKAYPEKEPLSPSTLHTISYALGLYLYEYCVKAHYGEEIANKFHSEIEKKDKKLIYNLNYRENGIYDERVNVCSYREELFEYLDFKADSALRKFPAKLEIVQKAYLDFLDENNFSCNVCDFDPAPSDIVSMIYADFARIDYDRQHISIRPWLF